VPPAYGCVRLVRSVACLQEGTSGDTAGL